MALILPPRAALRGELFRQEACVGGRWIGSVEHVPVFNPSTLEKIGQVPALGRAARLEVAAGGRTRRDPYALA